MRRAQFVEQAVKRLLAAGAVATLTLPAYAQEAATAAAAEPKVERVEEVVVTGSRIAAPNLTSTSPIQVVTSNDIRVAGKTDISDIILQLPQNYDNGLGQDLGNRTSGLTTAGGVATADLRGLGPNRTLVLVDGIRLGIGSPYTFIQSPAPDLDQIPTFLLDRVEVVTGGASATYGSDAIAGVINFIMKKNFQGVQVDGQLGENWHSNHSNYWQQQDIAFHSTPATGTSKDGRNRNVDVVLGSNFADGKGNVTAFFSYFHTDPVSGADRDWSSCQASEVFDPNTGEVTGQVCGGSSNSNYFRVNNGPLKSGTVYSVFGTSFVPQGSVLTTPPAAFNSQPYIYMTRQDTRYTAGFMAHEEVNDYFKPYGQFFFTDDQTHQAIAPAALFKDSNPNDSISGNYNVNCSNPLLSAQQAGILCTPAMIAADAANPGANPADIVNVRIGRRNIEGGGRFSDFQHSSYRAVLGSKGDFLDAWNYDVYGQYYFVSFFNSNSKYLNFANIDQALLVTGTKANPVCINANAPGCVPYNIWSDGGVTQDQLKYLYLTGTGSGSYTMRTTHGEITGDLGKYGLRLPTARDGIAINVGAEHRNEKQVFNPDAAEASGQLSGFGSAAVAIDNGDSVTEEWAELRAPLVQDKPFAKDLVFDTAVRHSDYSIAGKVNTYKYELQWAPISDLRFRGTFQRAIRAPTLIELFNPQLVGLIQFGNDPCAPTLAGNVVVPATASFAQCAVQGVTAAQYGNGGTTNTVPQASNGQLSQLTGGSLKLQPETSKSWTVGFTLTPEFAPGLTGSLDYFHIAVDKEVGVIPASVIMSTCLASSAPLYCSQIVRTPNTGGLVGNNIPGGGYFIQTNVNVGAALVSGVDAQLNYKWTLPGQHLGALGFALNGSYLQHDEATPLPGQHTYDCSGLFGFTCQTVNPRWRHIFRASWLTPLNVDLAATWRYLGKVNNDNNDNDPSLHFAVYGAFTNQPAVVGSYSYLDLAFTWHALNNLEVRGGVNNVTDKDPPVVPFFIQPGGANAYSAYDQLGRQLFIAFTAKF